MIWWPPETPVLYHGDISLRPARESDILPIFTACQDPAISRFTTVPSPYQLSDAEGFIRQISPQSFANKTELLFAIAKGHGEADQFCGLISFHTTNLGYHTTELGYWIAKEARSKGIGAAAVRLITDYGFTTMGFRRIEALVDPENLASRSLLLSAGYSLEGIMRNKVTRRDGEQKDMDLFAKVDSE
jgi:RimJ/RimL family protein N-acetyltransferase